MEYDICPMCGGGWGEHVEWAFKEGLVRYECACVECDNCHESYSSEEYEDCPACFPEKEETMGHKLMGHQIIEDHVTFEEFVKRNRLELWPEPPFGPTAIGCYHFDGCGRSLIEEMRRRFTKLGCALSRTRFEENERGELMAVADVLDWPGN